jgi:hypothetical protein
VILNQHSLIAVTIGLGLALPWSAPARAQTVDDILTSGILPADVRSAPVELNLGYGMNSALRVASEETLMDDHEFGFCFAKNEDKSDAKLGASIQAESQSWGGSMGISLHCDDEGKLPAIAEMHTHPSFSVGIPSTEDFGGIDPKQLAFVVAHPVDGETTAILMTRAARDQHTLDDPKSVASAAAVMRVMVLEFLEGAEPQSASRSANFANLYLAAICGKLDLACYHRDTWASKFTKIDGFDGFINTSYDAAARRRGFVRVQFLLDWLGGKDFQMPNLTKPLAIDSMKQAMGQLDLLQPQWQGAVMFTSPHVIMNVQFPADASDNFVGLAIPPDSTGKIVEKGGTALRTFSATEDASDPDAAISGCIRLGENVTIDGARYDDALFGDISSGQFQHHCFSLRAGSALQLTADETVADGYMTTVMSNGGEGSAIKTALADFCPPPSREKIVFCNKKPSFTVP